MTNLCGTIIFWGNSGGLSSRLDGTICKGGVREIRESRSVVLDSKELYQSLTDETTLVMRRALGRCQNKFCAGIVIWRIRTETVERRDKLGEDVLVHTCIVSLS